MSASRRRGAACAEGSGPVSPVVSRFDPVLRNVLDKWRERRRKHENGLLVPARARSGQAKIAVTGLGLRYPSNDVEALKDLAFDVHSGEFVCLLGPSGCGKTSLLYALAGTFTPSSGKISVDGVPVRGPSPDRLLMFQEPALFPWLTVRQNLVFALGSKPMRRAERERRAREFLQLVKLDGFEGYLPHQLSGGMRMRVSLARALAMDPAILLMDEPFGALDAQTREEMHVLLQQIWLRSRKTIVFVTHNIREALVLGDRVVVMATKPGRILRDVEVHLERPRHPDDERLVRLSRQIREWLGQPEGAREAPVGEGEDVRAEQVVVAPPSVPLGPGGALGGGV